jgi:CheY-like chemotaxis protein
VERTGDEAAMAEPARWAWWMPASLACLLRMPATAAQHEQKPDPLPGADGGRAGLRVLVVEDDVALAEALRWDLGQEGYAVDVEHTGRDGLWRARENPYDVIVLDVVLPGIDGHQIRALLRAEGRWTPILMLTAMDDGLERAGMADEYLSKPFSYPTLLARLRALTRRA